MATKLISEAAAKATLDDTDMVPVAKSGEGTAYHVTGAALFDSIPSASTSVEGKAELATAGELAAGTSGKVVEAGTLSAGLAGSHFIDLGSTPPTLGTINTAFASTFARAQAEGDLITLKDSSNDYFILVYDTETTAWSGINATDGAFVSYT